MSYRIPLVRPCLPERAAFDAAVDAIYATGRLSNFGPYSDSLEQETCSITGAPHAAAVSNATAGLWIVLNTLPANSEVIVPSFTFVATIQAITTNPHGLVPVFADVDSESLNVSPDAVERAITKRTSAILAVHAFGAPCEVDALEEIATRYGLKLFFDAAHAFGSRFRGQAVGAFGDAEVFSLSATKVIPAGEGGVIATRSDILHRGILDRRNYGLQHNGSRDCANDGVNGKITELAAALAVEELRTLDARVHRRNEIATRYLAGLRGLPGVSFQFIDARNVTTYKDFVVIIDPVRFGVTRDELRAHLKRRGIETAPYFWPPAHRMIRFARYAAGADLPVTEHAAGRILSLPIYEELRDEEVDSVIDAVVEARLALAGATAL